MFTFTSSRSLETTTDVQKAKRAGEAFFFSCFLVDLRADLRAAGDLRAADFLEADFFEADFLAGDLSRRAGNLRRAAISRVFTRFTVSNIFSSRI